MSEHIPAAVVNVQPAQNYVTREVFDATVGPIAADVAEMKGDVKTLLSRDAESRGAQNVRIGLRTHLTAIIAGSLSAIATIGVALAAH